MTIDGTARGPVFVVGGNVSVGAHGQAANVTIIGGQLRAAPGSQLHGDVFQFGGPTPELTGWTLAAAILIALALRTLLVWIVVESAGRLTRSRHARALNTALRDRPGRTVAAGVLASAGLLALSLVLLLTVVASVVALMIFGLLIAALPVGLATLFDLIDDLAAPRARFLIAAIPIVGDALLALSLAVGAGVLLRLIARARPAVEALPAARS